MQGNVCADVSWFTKHSSLVSLQQVVHNAPSFNGLLPGTLDVVRRLLSALWLLL